MVSELILEIIYLDMKRQCNNVEEKIDYLRNLISNLEEDIDDMTWNSWDY